MVPGGVDQQHHKFIATQPGYHIGIAADLLDQVGKGNQHSITFPTAMQVVDRLEMLEIQIQQRHGQALAGTQLQALLGQS